MKAIMVLAFVLKDFPHCYLGTFWSTVYEILVIWPHTFVFRRSLYGKEPPIHSRRSQTIHHSNDIRYRSSLSSSRRQTLNAIRAVGAEGSHVGALSCSTAPNSWHRSSHLSSVLVYNYPVTLKVHFSSSIKACRKGYRFCSRTAHGCSPVK